MKKYLLLLVSLFCVGISFSEERLSDISIYQDLSQLYENDCYPAAIEKVDLLLSLHPDSVFIQPSLFIKARSLINLNYYEDAKETLQNTIPHMHTGKEGYAQCHYLLGISNFYLGLYDEALEKFYQTCKLSLINDEKEYYDSSIFFAAESYYILKKYDKAYPLYEYVIQHGQDYEKGEYTSCILRLIDSYNKTQNYEKSISLYLSFLPSLNEGFFDDSIKTLITLYTADAYEKDEQYSESYELYKKVIESKNEKLSIQALKNAYKLSEKNLIDVSMGELFSKVSNDYENKTIVDDFWLRLGIDEYNNKNYQKALSYFENIKEKENLNVVNIYKAKIALDSDNSVKGAEEALSYLSLIEMDEENENKKIDIKDSYYSLLLQCYIQKDEWDKVSETFEKIKEPTTKDIYNLSSFYYEKGMYEKVDPSASSLYASALCKRGLYKEANAEYEKIEQNGKLELRDYSEWAKALFNLGEYDKAFDKALKSDDEDKDYIAGLCKINTNELNIAKGYFMSYIRKNSNKDNFIHLSLYFKGYIEYRNEEYKNAYNTFVRFITESGTDELPFIRNSHYYASLSSLQNKDYETAIKHAKEYLSLSMNREDKIKAVVFNFELLNDAKKYDEAISLILPYTKETTSFTPSSLFMLASVYAKRGEIELSDSTYKEIFDKYPQSKEAEEALYKRGEVYYFDKTYDTAYNRFKDYINEYVEGRFLDAALYYSGECAYKLAVKNSENINKDNLDKAIMSNKNMLQKFPESVYAYGSYKTLLNSYYARKDYDEALGVAKIMMKNYPEQASSDNIGKKIQDLEKIVSGTDSRIVEKLSLFEEKGKVSTKDGRKLCSEIIKLYANNENTENLAYEYASLLLTVEEIEDDEYPLFAEASEFMGDYLRENADAQKAGESYLKAAGYYRKSENDAKAASVLYAAAQSFVQAGKMGDARSVRDSLKELYPNSNAANVIDSIVR